MYLLRGPRRARDISPALRREMLKLERYQVQFRYLRENRIETRQQLTMLRDALQGEMDAHTEQRDRRRHAACPPSFPECQRRYRHRR